MSASINLSTIRVNSIHYLRGLAAMIVVFHHSLIQVNAYLEVSPRTDLGSFGVDLFFIISGFVIWVATRRSTESVSRFLYKRLIRVVPLYWLMTCILALSFWTEPEAFRTTSLQMTHFVKSLLFVPHYNLGHPGEIWPLLIPGWTLNYEMFFYMVFGILLLFFRSRVLLMLTLIFLALVLAGFLTSPSNALLKIYTSDYLLEFWLGVVLANLYLLGKFRKDSLWMGLVIMFAAVILASLSEAYRMQVANPGIFWGFPAALLVAGALIAEESGNFVKYRILFLLGDASYAIYLTHLFTLGAVRALWGDMIKIESEPVQKWLFSVVGLLLSAAVGVVVHLLIEKPLLDALRRWRPRPWLTRAQTDIR